MDVVILVNLYLVWTMDWMMGMMTEWSWGEGAVSSLIQENYTIVNKI